jgi:hypothetical protein
VERRSPNRHHRFSCAVAVRAGGASVMVAKPAAVGWQWQLHVWALASRQRNCDESSVGFTAHLAENTTPFRSRQRPHIKSKPQPGRLIRRSGLE